MTVNSKVETLINTDLKSLMQAIEQHDLSLLRMNDGAAPTKDQLQIILSASPEDLDESKKEMKRRMEQAHSALFPTERIEALMEKYGADQNEALGVVAQRMSPEDQDELRGLVQWLADEERNGHGDRSA